MMIFKRLKTVGNIGLSTALSTLGVAASFLILQFSLQNYRTNLRNSQESDIMLFAHSVAALLKEDIRSNYSLYTTTSDPTWANCRTTPSISQFINSLNAPTGNCRNVNFTFSNFQVIPSANGNVSTALKLSELSPTLNTTKRTFRPIKSLGLSQFDTVVTITSFNTAADRNLIEGTIQLTSTSPDLNLNKSVPLAIDIAKTVQSPVGNAISRLCRSVAGSVCNFASAGQYDLTFLDGNGQIFRVAADNSISTTGLSAALTTVSVKNIENNQKTEYTTNSFCLPTAPNSPVPWILDAASDVSGKTYYLTVHGMLLDSTGTNKWAQNDPKIVSIANDNVNWFLLRSDGTVLQTTDIEGRTGEQERVKLPTATSITTGKGPNPC